MPIEAALVRSSPIGHRKESTAVHSMGRTVPELAEDSQPPGQAATGAQRGHRMLVPGGHRLEVGGQPLYPLRGVHDPPAHQPASVPSPCGEGLRTEQISCPVPTHAL